jgi:hypothetical protein
MKAEFLCDLEQLIAGDPRRDMEIFDRYDLTGIDLLAPLASAAGILQFGNRGGMTDSSGLPSGLIYLTELLGRPVPVLCCRKFPVLGVANFRY